MSGASNYEKQCQQWRERFLTMDMDRICQYLPEIQKTDDAYIIRHFGRTFAISRKDGTMRVLNDTLPITVISQINIFTLFWYCKPNAALRGDWLPFKSLPGGSAFEKAFQSGVLDALAATFSGRENLLEEAVVKLGGKRISSSSFELYAFGCMPVRLNFWDADDEFPAQVNILFDSSATDFTHVETIVTIATELMYQLADVAGISVLGAPFYRF